MKNLLIVLFFMANSAFAAKLEDVKILSTAPAKDSVKLKLHASQGPEGSYFFVDLMKSDPASFDKMALVIRKLERADHFKLNLEIPSFSMLPSGSYYRSESVNFSGTELEE